MTNDVSANFVAHRLPVEVYEFVIKAVRGFQSVHFHPNFATLRTYALICHAWRPRSQTILFRTVEFADSCTLNRFAAHLGEVPHLADHIRQLMLVSRSLHGADSAAVQFASIFTGRLPNLVSSSSGTSSGRRHGTPMHRPHRFPPVLRQRFKELPCLPLHSRFLDVLEMKASNL